MWKYIIYKKKNTNGRVLTTQDNGILSGYNVVITGTLWTTRDNIFRMIRDAGGRPQDRVDSRTNLLVIGHQPGNTKINDAQRYGLEYVAGEDLRNILDGRDSVLNRSRSVSDYIAVRLRGI